VVGTLLSVPVALGATTPAVPQTGQRIDMRVLLVSANGTEAGYGGWKAALEREGVPYTEYIADQHAAPLADADLADYATNHAKYSAVILASGDLNRAVGTTFTSAFTTAEWATLAKYEKTFGIRQLSDETFPAPSHGLTSATAITVDTTTPLAQRTAALTAAGKTVFPYLKGDVPIDAGTIGNAATPVSTTDFQSLVSGPSGGTILGVYTHPEDGREEMVMTVPSNAAQIHNQLLRHGMLSWVLRGMYLGYQRNYLELHVDDLFLGDDAWQSTTNVTSYDPTLASRMTPADLAQAIAWSKSRGLRLDMVFNGGGSALYLQDHPTATSDPLLDAVKALPDKKEFGWINHTLEHPNLNCSTAPYITRQIADNIAFANANGLPLDSATELVTGEHSGLANTVPGNPGTIDPPFFTEDTDVTAAAGASLAGSYEWGVTAVSPAGETPASISSPLPVTAGNSATIHFDVVCGATSYKVYRRANGGAWSQVGTVASTANAPTDNGTTETSLTFTDTGAAGTAAAPPVGNTASLAAYGQNPAFYQALVGAGIKSTATDASKQYPDTSVASNPFGLTVTGAALLPAGASFTEGTGAAAFQAIPRYPSNVYYNVSKQSQQLDEYNWIYYSGAPTNGTVNDGGCAAPRTDCRTTPATWADYLGSENQIMFGHLMGNDPRPHYIHQSNLADWNPALPETDPNQGGILYAVIDGLLGNWYDKYFDRPTTPLVQLTQTQIGAELARQKQWAQDVAAGRVSAYLLDGKLHVSTTADMQVPLTGTTVGDVYGGQRSGLATVKAGTEAVFSPDGTAVVQPPVSTPQSPAPQSPAPQTPAQEQPAAPTPVAPAAPQPLPVTPAPKPTVKPTVKPVTVKLTRVSMTQRRFAIRGKAVKAGRVARGSTVAWTIDRAATVRLKVQRLVKGRWTAAGTLSRKAKAGRSSLAFTGTVAGKRLAPGRYRLVVAATASGRTSAARTIAFRVVKG